MGVKIINDTNGPSVVVEYTSGTPTYVVHEYIERILRWLTANSIEIELLDPATKGVWWFGSEYVAKPSPDSDDVWCAVIRTGEFPVSLQVILKMQFSGLDVDGLRTVTP